MVLRQCLETGGTSTRQVPLIETGSEIATGIQLTAEPLQDAGPEALVAVLFAPVLVWRQPGDGLPEPEPREAEAILEREARDLRERLQSTVEEYETALEELKSSNEELVSVNEEAQSTNEELEASKEEMQSLNEELSTINAELATHVQDLDQANTDLKNLYAATEIATVFLDGKLVVRNFTPAAAQFFNLRQADVGRPLTDLAAALHYPDLEAQVQEVFSTGTKQERRLSIHGDGESYLVRLMPYREQDDGISGVVVTLIDITSLARAERQQQVLISELNHRVKNMLAVVISITNNTLNTTLAPEDFSERLIGRLHGMSRAYGLLTDADWTTVTIRELLQAESDTYGNGRITVEGPDVALSAEQALSVGMVVHELATNAVKYGALSADDGRVEVCWQVQGDRLELTWRECDGPEVSAPERRGFGLTLIEGQVRYQNEGELDVQFEPGGLELTMRFALRDQAGPAGP
jgi:two-component system CheB/CheR fusion protein